MYNLIRGYLERLPRSMCPVAEGSTLRRCIYTPHFLRATTATLLLKAGVELVEVQELLGHKHVTTTQIYDKRVRQTREGSVDRLKRLTERYGRFRKARARLAQINKEILEIVNRIEEVRRREP